MYREIVWKGMNLIQLAHRTASCPNTVLEFDPIKSGMFEASFKMARLFLGGHYLFQLFFIPKHTQASWTRGIAYMHCDIHIYL
jgi:hypothetical protein